MKADVWAEDIIKKYDKEYEKKIKWENLRYI